MSSSIAHNSQLYETCTAWIRLRISADMAEWLRNYSRSKGISLNRSISNAIENEMMRKQKRRLKHI